MIIEIERRRTVPHFRRNRFGRGDGLIARHVSRWCLLLRWSSWFLHCTVPLVGLFGKASCLYFHYEWFGSNMWFSVQCVVKKQGTTGCNGPEDHVLSRLIHEPDVYNLEVIALSSWKSLRALSSVGFTSWHRKRTQRKLEQVLWYPLDMCYFLWVEWLEKLYLQFFCFFSGK